MKLALFCIVFVVISCSSYKTEVDDNLNDEFAVKDEVSSINVSDTIVADTLTNAKDALIRGNHNIIVVPDSVPIKSLGAPKKVKKD